MKCLRSVFAGLALIGLTFFGSASPALAHANETSTSPAAGSTIEAGLIPIEISFGEKLMNLGADQGNVVQIQAPDGSLPSTSCWVPADTGSTTQLSATAQLAIPGKYVVTWRVVSADGHPVEGLFDFTVKNTAGFEVDPAIPACGADSSAVESPMPIRAPVDDGATTVVTQWNWIGLGAIAAAVIGLIIWLVLRRTQRSE